MSEHRMDEHRDLERRVAAWIADEGAGTPPARVLEEILTTTSRTRPRPRWLALMKEPPMRISSHVAVGSPTARLATIAVATLLLALMAGGAVVAGATLLAGPGVIVVAQDGSGDYETITAAVAAAEDGDTILIRPGTYPESVVIDKDIMMSGDGPREEIVIEPSEGSGSLRLSGSDAVISDLTLRGRSATLVISGGAPTIEGLAFDGVGLPFGGPGQLVNGEYVAWVDAITVKDGSTAHIRANVFNDWGGLGVYYGAAPRFEGNDITGGSNIFIDSSGGAAEIVGNTIRDQLVRGMWLGSPQVRLVEANTIVDPAQEGIVYAADQEGIVDGRAATIIRGNTIDGGSVGIIVHEATGSVSIEGNTVSGAQWGVRVFNGLATIARNTLTDNGAGISLNGSDALVEANAVEGGDVGIVVSGGGSPTLRENVVEGASVRGIAIGNGTSATLEGNTICGNEVNLWIAENAEPVLGDNEICPDGLAAVTE